MFVIICILDLIYKIWNYCFYLIFIFFVFLFGFWDYSFLISVVIRIGVGLYDLF